MTVSSDVSKSGPFAANGTQTVFTFNFRVDSASDFQVITANASGAETVLVLNSNYSVSLNPDQEGSPGGSVTFLTAPLNGHTVTFVRSIPLLQTTSVTNFRPEVTETVYDRIVMMIQQIKEEVGRAVKVTVSSLSNPDDLITSILQTLSDAQSAANDAQDAVSEVNASKDAALAAATNAQTQATNAAISASTASSFSINAANSASNAASSASGAAGSASAAAGSANAALATLAQVQDALLVFRTVDVTDFGAVGNGVANDSVAVETAINSISSGTVVFPAGVYRIGSVPPKPGVKFVGLENVTLVASAPNVYMFTYLNNVGSLQVDFEFEHLNFNTGGHSGVTAIYLDGNTSGVRISNIRLHDLYFEGAFARAINLRYTANTFISDIFCVACVTGITLDNCADSDLVNCKVQSGTGSGFRVLGGPGAFDEGTRLTNCSTNGQGLGLEINGADWGVVSGCSFTTAPLGGARINSVGATNWKFANCEFATAGTGPSNPAFQVLQGAEANVRYIQFSSCFFSNSTFGLVLRGLRFTVTGCQFAANSNVDIYIGSSSFGNVISGCFMESGVVASSVAEEVGADYTLVTGSMANGSINLSGANSTAANNTLY